MTAEDRSPLRAGTIVVLPDGQLASVLARQVGPCVHVGWFDDARRFYREKSDASTLLVLVEAPRGVRR